MRGCLESIDYCIRPPPHPPHRLTGENESPSGPTGTLSTGGVHSSTGNKRCTFSWLTGRMPDWLAGWLFCAFFFFFLNLQCSLKKKGTRRRKHFNELKISWIRWGISGELHASTLKNSSQWIRLKRELLFPAPKRVHSPSWTVTWRRLSLKWA